MIAASTGRRPPLTIIITYYINKAILGKAGLNNPKPSSERNSLRESRRFYDRRTEKKAVLSGLDVLSGTSLYEITRTDGAV